MAIDIDSFLEKYNSENKKNDEAENKINFDFQKDVEDKILKAENRIIVDNKFEILEKIYDEIKKFDEDIPSKFLGIENKGNIALKTIGEKYSKEFLHRIKENVSVLDINIKKQFTILDTKLNTEDFYSIIKEFEILLKLIESYPKQFLNQKLKFNEELRKREIVINKKINEYKNTKLKNIKVEINQYILNLNKSLSPDNIVEIENNIYILQNLLKNIPKIFLTEVTNEKIIISKTLIIAEKYLENEYVNEFNKKEENLNKLIEKFHSSYISKNLSKTLILYDQILLEFESLPEVFFERKMAIYEKTNNLYSMINDLFIKNNLAILVQSYNASQIFKETRDYLRHVQTTSKLNIETLTKLENKIKLLPEKCEPEKSNLLKKIIEIKNKKIKKDNTNLENKTNNENLSQIEEEKLILENKKKINKEIMTEINSQFMKLKKTDDPHELRLRYKKILFYLNNLDLNHETKKEILDRINKILVLKNKEQ